MEPAITLVDVTKDFVLGLTGRRLRALDRVSLAVPAGCICGLIGPNGGGKSSVIKLLAGLMRPTSGAVRMLGHAGGSLAARRLLGYLPESPRFPQLLTGEEFLRYHARLSGLPTERLDEAIGRVLQRVGLGAAGRRIGTYSKGMHQRLGLAQALVHGPQVLVLDEPMDGLDPGGARELAELLRELRADGCTILVSGHQLAIMEQLCDHLVLLNRGRCIVQGAINEWLGVGDGLQLTTDPLAEPELAALRGWLDERGSRLRTVHGMKETLEGAYARELAAANGEGRG